MPLDWQLIKGETLDSINLDCLVQGVQQFECITFQEEISRLERDEARWTDEQRECLRFISAVLTMMLRADQPAEPFGPMFVMGGQRSAIPADFPKDVLRDLQTWVMSLSDPELRARFLDLLWVQARSFPAAQGAVEAYLASALRLEHPEEWTSCHERLERALRLAASLGKGGEALRLQALGEVEAMLHRHRGTDPLFLTLRLTKLLLQFKHGDAKQYADYANAAAATAEDAQDFWRANSYYQLAAECYHNAGDTDSQGVALRSAAESLVKEAELAHKSGRGAMVAASVLSDAVEAMRQAPGGRERAATLHERLLILQQESVAELKPIESSTDIGELVRCAVAAVLDQPINVAVYALCTMAGPPSVEKLKHEVFEQAHVAILGSLLSSEVLNSRGRVVARAPALEDGANDPTKHEGLRWRMFRQARLQRSLTVQAMLNPVRLEILATHGLDRLDVESLIQFSPWVPPDHTESILRALVAGFQGDMLVAGHLIPPQLEAVVRHVVESRGGATSMLEPGGVQPERPLGILLDSPEALQAFGADGVFELQDLLIDPLGTNLRNEVAHGLLGDSGLFGDDVLYAWWLLLRYCVITSKIVERNRTTTETSSKT